MDAPMVSVVAPATLAQGYTFEAQLGGRTFTATVVSERSVILKRSAGANGEGNQNSIRQKGPYGFLRSG